MDIFRLSPLVEGTSHFTFGGELPGAIAMYEHETLSEQEAVTWLAKASVAGLCNVPVVRRWLIYDADLRCVHCCTSKLLLRDNDVRNAHPESWFRMRLLMRAGVFTCAEVSVLPHPFPHKIVYDSRDHHGCSVACTRFDEDMGVSTLQRHAVYHGLREALGSPRTHQRLLEETVLPQLPSRLQGKFRVAFRRLCEALRQLVNNESTHAFDEWVLDPCTISAKRTLALRFPAHIMHQIGDQLLRDVYVPHRSYRLADVTQKLVMHNIRAMGFLCFVQAVVYICDDPRVAKLRYADFDSLLRVILPTQLCVGSVQTGHIGVVRVHQLLAPLVDKWFASRC